MYCHTLVSLSSELILDIIHKHFTHSLAIGVANASAALLSLERAQRRTVGLIRRRKRIQLCYLALSFRHPTARALCSVNSTESHCEKHQHHRPNHYILHTNSTLTRSAS